MNNQLTKWLGAVSLALSAQAVSADMLGLHLGVGVWQNESDGDLLSLAVPQDTSDLGMDDDNANFFYVKFEHPVPMLPNLRLAQSGAGTTGDVNMVYGGIDATLKTDIDLDHMDYTLYWEVIDTGMDLDIGLTARRFDGSLTQEVYSNLVPGTVLGSQVQPIEGTIPMLYINARVELPFTGFYVGGEINSLSYQGDGFNDLTAKVGWSTDSWIMPEFGVELGYRKMSLDIDASNKLDTTLDLSIDGYYLALVGHF